MAEKSNAELLQILTAKFRKAEKGGALSNERVAYAKWLKDNTGVKLLKNGKRETVWKSGENKGKTFNPKEGSKLFNKQYWGTETPRKDLKYLQESEQSRLRIKTQRGDSLRTRWSKDDFEGKNIYQQEVTGRETKDKARLAKLRIGTSFAEQENTNLKNLVKKNQTSEQDTEQLVDKVIDSNGGDSKVLRHQANQRPSPGTVDLLGAISKEMGIVNPDGSIKDLSAEEKGKLGLEVGSENAVTSGLSINSSDATPGTKAKEKLTMPKPWARKWAGGDGRKLKDVNKDTEAYLRQEGWGEALDSSRDKDELLRAARTDQLLISKGFVHTDDGVFKIDKKEEVLTA